MTAADPLGRVGRRELEERLRIALEQNTRLSDELAELRSADPTLVGWHCGHCGVFNDERTHVAQCSACGKDAPTLPAEGVSRIADLARVVRIFDAIRDERRRQDERHGPIDVALLTIEAGTGGAIAIGHRERTRLACAHAFATGKGTWRHILTRRMAAVCAERHADGLRPALVRLAATCVRWIEVIDEFAESDD